MSKRNSFHSSLTPGSYTVNIRAVQASRTSWGINKIWVRVDRSHFLCHRKCNINISPQPTNPLKRHKPATMLTAPTNQSVVVGMVCAWYVYAIEVSCQLSHMHWMKLCLITTHWIYCCQKLSGIHTVYINWLLNIVPYRCMFVYYLLTIYVKALFSLCTKAFSGAEQSISLLEYLTIGRQTNTLLFFAPL